MMDVMVPEDEFQGLIGNTVRITHRAETVAAPATVSGEPAANRDHWATGKVGNQARPASQETCHRCK